MRIKNIVGRFLLVAVGISALQLPSAFAQCSFTSGSTGADGDFNPTSSMPTNAGWTVSNNVVTVTNYPNGIFNFKSVYIETNWVVHFTKNALNTPVYILATSNVTVRGTIDVSGASPLASTGGLGGPGGFDGAAQAVSSGTPGYGPGGGAASGGASQHAPENAAYVTSGCPSCSNAYGVIDIQPFIGGSGGGAHGSSNPSGGGAGGGGAILIASSTIIDCSGAIYANGGYSPCCGDGSGGSIRLIAGTIQGEGVIQAFDPADYASDGRVRLEACTNHFFTLTGPPATFGPPTSVFLSTNPTIRVISIASQSVTSSPTGSLNVPDLYLPTNLVNPATITVAAGNIISGTTFKVIVVPANGTNMVATGTLSAGNYASSTGYVSISVYTDRVWRVNALIDYIPRP